LVNELNAKKAAMSMPASLVVGESTGIVLSNATPVAGVAESVAPAAEAKIETATLNANQVVVREFIRPFYL
jgi:hypothetical protein